MMTAVEQTLLNALVELGKAGNSMRTANPKPDRPARFARVNERTKQLPRGTAPALLHYLQKKGYEKGRVFLQGCDMENQVGNCRHV